MDFYARQDTARRKTGRLIALFCLALVLIVGAVNAAFHAVMYANFAINAFSPYYSFTYTEKRKQRLAARSEHSPEERQQYLDYARRLQESYTSQEKQREFVEAEKNALRLESERYLHSDAMVMWHIGLSLFVCTAILMTSFRHMAKLGSSGGDWLAERLGGTFVDPVEPGDPHLRRLINVMEEMAIAANIPRPNLYVLERETGINALAAGWDYEDAVIVVSRGALLELSRDELQGVIAHEMAHILSGDMRLNIRLVGLLYGILAVSVTGNKMLSNGWMSGQKNARALQFYLAGAALGVALMAIGSLGVFCGRLVRAGISRQREFLADAQAVRLTRNPDGLVGALKKIGGFTEGSRMKMGSREEVSHMFFASGQTFWTRLMATHPPLAERIRAIDSHFSADDFPEAARPTAPAFQDSGMVYVREAGLATQNVVAFTTEATGRSIHINSDAAAEFPHSLLRDAEQCETALLAALLRACGKMRKRSVRIASDDPAAIVDIVGEAIDLEMRRLLPGVKLLPPEQILPLAEMTLPKLDVLPKGERIQIIHMLDRLATMDDELTLAEYCLTRLARLYLTEEEKTLHSPRAQPQHSAARLRQAMVTLLTVMAWSGGKNEEAAARAFAAGIAMLLPKTAPAYEPIADWVAPLDEALGLVPELPEIMRKQIVAALAATIGHDGGVCLEEAELLRLACAALKLPIPSFEAGPGLPPRTAA